MARKITCTNNDGMTVTFGECRFNPFLLASVEGVYSSSNNVVISDNTMIDGGTYQGSVANVRNIVLTISDKPENVYRLKSRDLLYRLFPKGTEGTLAYWEDGQSREIRYYVESIAQEAPKKRLYTVSLLCPDPFFYDPTPIVVSMANWEPRFEFEHEFSAAGEELGAKSDLRLVDIINDIASDDIGMTITITATGSVKNPTITRVESNEHITIGTSAFPFSLSWGDAVIITTDQGNKHIWLVRDGESTEVNQYISEDSEFIHLMRGHNTIGYSADEGEQNLSVEISYRLKYEGA